MRKLPVTLSVTVLLISAIATAQHIKWWGIPKDKDVQVVQSFIGYDTGGYYIHRVKHKLIALYYSNPAGLIEKRSYDNKIIYSKSAKYAENGKEYYFIKTLMMKNGPIVIQFDRSTESYYAFNVSSTGDLVNKSFIVADNGGHVGFGAAMQNSENAACRFKVSPDKTTLLAYHGLKGNKMMQVQLFGLDLKQKWSRNVGYTPSEGANLLRKDVTIDDALVNDNNAYFFILSKTKKGDWPMYSMYMVSSSGDPQETKFTPQGGGVCITSALYKFSKEGDILVGGVTQKYDPNRGFDDKGTTGYCLMLIDPTSGKITLNSANNFDNSFLLKYIGSGKIKRGKGIPLLTPQKIVETSDKSLLLITEQQEAENYTYTTMVTTTTGAGTSQSMQTSGGSTFRSLDIVIIKLNTDGSQAWVQDIPKKQQIGIDTKYIEDVSSFGYWTDANNLYLFYNDNKENVKLNADEMEKNRKDINGTDLSPYSSALMLEIVNLSDGSLKRKTFGEQYNRKGDKTMVYCAMAKRMENVIWLYRSNKKTNMEQFGEIVLTNN